MRDLKRRTALITGGASGIGLGMAEAFADAGMNLVLADNNEAALADAAASLKGAGAAVLARMMDVTDRAAWRATAEAAEARFGGVDVLCNNAGIAVLGWDVDAIKPELWDLTVGINLTGAFNGCHEFVPRMKRRGCGHIVNTGSVSSLRGRASHAVYVATKHAILGLSESLALEGKEHNIGVTIVCPGHVATNLNDNSRRQRAAIADGRSPKGEDQGIFEPSAMKPRVVGDMVREAVERNLFYVITHPEYRSIVSERHAELLRAFDHADARGR
jgi:NAD(P)-dependent dehydrogenase (short-subunit alcohol dehydrogenase family)